MNATARRSLLGSALALSLLMAACGSDSKSSSDTTGAPATEAATTAAGAATTAAEATTTGAPAEDLSKLSATLNASGATFPQAFYEDQIAAFQKDASGVTINYGGGGSGKGRQDLADQVTDWAGSDAPVKAEDLPKFKGGDILYFPTVLAPITLSYNLDGGRQPPADAARSWPRSSSARSRTGTIRPSRPTTRTPSCPTRPSRWRSAPTAPARRRTSPSSSMPLWDRRRRHLDAEERLDGAVAG